MSIQVTPIPRLTVLTAPAFTLGTANAAGSAITAVASNSTILTYDTTDPAAVAAAAVVGSATTAARRDHVHTGTPIASPGVAKAWVRYEQTGAHSMAASYNMTSVSDGGGAGDSDLLWATDFSSANYAIVSMTERSYCCGNDGGAGQPATTGVNMFTFDTTTYAGTDINFNFVAAFGAQ
jgi:hypothetical protein